MKVLNAGFSGSGLNFALENTTRTVNAVWFGQIIPGSAVEAQMKQQLRQGGPETLNVYTVGYVVRSLSPWRVFIVRL